jgi:hypothetical protein
MTASELENKSKLFKKKEKENGHENGTVVVLDNSRLGNGGVRTELYRDNSEHAYRQLAT